MIRILIADNEALVRGGLRMILEADAGIAVVGEAGDGVDALNQARALSPDLVLMDIRMPDLDGIEATRRLLAGPARVPKVLVLTTFDLDDYVYEAIRAGASGFLLKSAPPRQLVHGVHAVMSGEALLAPEITRRLLDRFIERRPHIGGTPPELAELTVRELEVLRLIADGHSNAEIDGQPVVSRCAWDSQPLSRRRIFTIATFRSLHAYQVIGYAPRRRFTRTAV
jgi:DNA-binding NarL/FixJ family response regulator